MVHLENLNQSLPPVRAEIIIVGLEVIFPQSWVTCVKIIAAATFFKYLCSTLKQWRISPKFPDLQKYFPETL